GPPRDRGRREDRREDRDRRRAAIPGALRRGDGVPASYGAVPEPVGGRGAAAAGRFGSRRRGPRRTTPTPSRAGRGGSREGGTMTETAPRQRSGGRDAR